MLLSHSTDVFYCDAIVPLPIDMANGFAIIPNDVLVEPDGASCDKTAKRKRNNTEKNTHMMRRLIVYIVHIMFFPRSDKTRIKKRVQHANSI